MSRSNVQVFLAIVFGVVLGAVTGLTVRDSFGALWVAGLLTSMVVGGLSGYVTYDSAAIIKAVPKTARLAWRYALTITGWRVSELTKIKIELMIKLAPHCLLVGLIVGCWVMIGLSPIIRYDLPITDILRNCLGLLGMVTLIVFIFCLVTSTEPVDGDKDERKTVTVEKLRDEWRQNCAGFDSLCIWCNPFTVLLFWLPIGLVYAAKHYLPPAFFSAVRGARTAISFTIYFCLFLLREIHCEQRLVCLAYGSIFAGVAYFFGSAGTVVLAALAGGLLGVFNRQVVFKRWLQAVPNNV